MKKVYLFVLFITLLLLSGCSKKQDLPEFDYKDYLFESGADSDSEELRNVFVEFNDEVMDRTARHSDTIGFVNYRTLEEDEGFYERTDMMPSVIDNDFYKMTKSDFTDTDVKTRLLIESRVRYSTASPGFGSLLNMVLDFDLGKEEEIVEFDDSQSSGIYEYRVNQEQLYMYRQQKLKSVDYYTSVILLRSEIDDKHVEYYTYINYHETDFAYYESCYIEDEYSYIEYIEHVGDRQAYTYVMYDVSKDELMKLKIYIEDDSYTVSFEKMLLQEDLLFKVELDENNKTETLSYLSNGVSMVDFIRQEIGEKESLYLSHNFMNIDGFDYMGGVSPSSFDNQEHLVKDEEIVDLGDWQIIKNYSMFRLQKEIDSIPLHSNAFDMGNLHSKALYDFDIKLGLERFEGVDVYTKNDSFYINNKEYQIKELDFLKSIVNDNFSEEMEEIESLWQEDN